jgi:hypothetical protein
MDARSLTPQLKNFLDPGGRLKGWPARRKLQILALFYLAAQFEPDRRYAEKEVNLLLKGWHTFDDWCLLRRELYDGRFLNREANGSVYWLEDPQPTLADFALT